MLVSSVSFFSFLFGTVNLKTVIQCNFIFNFQALSSTTLAVIGSFKDEFGWFGLFTIGSCLTLIGDYSIIFAPYFNSNYLIFFFILNSMDYGILFQYKEAKRRRHITYSRRYLIPLFVPQQAPYWTHLIQNIRF
jgi:hypothetical protein